MAYFNQSRSRTVILPAGGRFATPETLTARAHQLADAFPDTSVRLLGQTDEGRPIEALTISGGPRQVVVLAGVHPDESVGYHTVSALWDVLAKPGAALRACTWHVVWCSDPDGAARHTPIQPLSVETYFTGETYYRPAPAEQPEWGYRPAHPADELAATRAVRGLIDEVRPDALVSLHNALSGGAFSFVTHRLVPLHRAMARMPARYSLPLADPEEAGDGPSTPWAPGVWRVRRPAPALGAGISSVQYAKLRYGTVGLIPEVPLFRAQASPETGLESAGRVLEAGLNLRAAASALPALEQTRSGRAARSQIGILPAISDAEEKRRRASAFSHWAVLRAATSLLRHAQDSFVRDLAALERCEVLLERHMRTTKTHLAPTPHPSELVAGAQLDLIVTLAEALHDTKSLQEQR
ncbi:M14 family zinc carboxypeptidase [Streptomyces sp. NPDC007088]|uniref:M14 family zinc carboxypeptidase n=1 Tax=Streptomyces sp. NPDC007088 TaxID=3364773 RepID=UPI0036850DEC